MLLATRCDSLCNFHGQLERGGGLKSRDLRLPTGPGAFDEGSELTLERLAVFDLDLRARDFPVHAPIDFAALILVIEREISVFLKDTNLTHALGTDPARRDIRDATVFETQPRVGDVFAAAQHRTADASVVLIGGRP